MKRSICLAALAFLLVFPLSLHAGNGYGADFRKALALFDRGLYRQARTEFETVAGNEGDILAEGYAVLCAEHLRAPGYETLFERYTDLYPYSPLIPQLQLRYALNLFDDEDYSRAARYFGMTDSCQLVRNQVPEYLFKYGYSCFKLDMREKAAECFREVDRMNSSDFSAPARYALGYMDYEDGNFSGAAAWFALSARDSRFETMSSYYMLDCRYMLKDYEYVAANGPDRMDSVPAECRPHLARMVSESMLVLGQADNARRYFASAPAPSTREDYFFAGSLMYAVQDWQAAVENYSAMTERTDSLGQIANYNMGYSYIRIKNKVAAMRAFKDASASDFNPEIAEDALFNHAKLAFDLNNDASVFSSYMEKYPSKAKNDRIYGYIAVAALRSRDYAAAAEAFDKIDELDEDMRSNYMKTNYLRANQLIADGAYKGAVPCLRASAYYAPRGSAFWQLSRFWLAESLFRSGDTLEARNIFTELYNTSALEGMEESSLIPFSIAYCYFKESDFDNAIRWFDSYVQTGATAYRKGALLRKADCWFMKKKYATAIPIYESVSAQYPNVNDIYPYYQTGICYGLAGSESKKISALLPVRQASPEARFYHEALYELGRTYVAAGNIAEAKSCFGDLRRNAKDSTYMAKALIELGMIARNSRQYDEAIGYYKQVVEGMPLCVEADVALAAIESIYQAKADPQSYFDYLASIGKSGIKTESEKETMIFNAAEQIYLSEDYERALAAFKDYMEKFPSGMMSDKAGYYVADSYRQLGQKETACDAYAAVVALGSGPYLEPALAWYSELAYGLHRYEDAYKAYSRLEDVAVFEENVKKAREGKMWAAFRGRMFDSAVEAAEAVRAASPEDENVLMTTRWITAKSYLATSRRDEALDLLVLLAVKPRTPEGAEAVYLLIQDCYDRGDFARTEELVYSFADSGSNQEYWIARAFMVLGDSFAERGDKEQALATYTSILEGYTPQDGDDDVLDNVKLRINRIKNQNL